MVLALYQYRFLTAEGICALLDLPRDVVQARLEALAAAGFLTRIRRPTLWEEPVPDVYALEQRGANLVATELGLDRAQVKWSPSRNRVKLLFLEHTLRVNDVRIAFTLAARGYHDQKLLTWRQGQQIADRVPDPDDATKWLPVRPDGYFCYRVGERRAHFFLEVDLGTETNRRYQQKVKAYIVYRQSRMYTTRYGAYAFRVLTLTTSARRLANLLRVTKAEGGGSMFWFATFGQLHEASAIETRWLVPNDARLKTLF